MESKVLANSSGPPLQPVGGVVRESYRVTSGDRSCADQPLQPNDITPEVVPADGLSGLVPELVGLTVKVNPEALCPVLQFEPDPARIHKSEHVQGDPLSGELDGDFEPNLRRHAGLVELPGESVLEVGLRME